MKKVILTGGGTAGHVTPNIALLPRLKEDGFEIAYIGSYNGIEKDLITKQGIKYYGIDSGKLRRYLDFKNITDSARVLHGIIEAIGIVGKEKPDVIFSKGGFVALPVVVAGKIRGIPIVIHESDISLGLATKLSLPFAKKVCTTFPDAAEKIKNNKAVVTGTPIRSELFDGNREKGLALCKFSGNKPILLVIGGSSGSLILNKCVRDNLPQILKIFDVCHICGKANVDETISWVGYKQFEYVTDELKHILKIADVIVSRAGSNAINEFLSLKKPCLLIPLSKNASRGDQILNAQSFKAQGFADCLQEEEITSENFVAKINDLYQNRAKYTTRMNQTLGLNATEKIITILNSVIK